MQRDMHPRSRGRSHRRRVRWARRLLIVTCAVVAVVLLLAGGGYGYLRYRFAQIHKVTLPALHLSSQPPHSSGPSLKPTSQPPSAPFTVLMVGEDGQGGGKRADTMILARVDPASGHLSVLSIPYDYFAPIAGQGTSNKISDALNWGPNTLVQTIENDLGVSVDDYVQISFQGVAAMVNALGGVRLDFPYASRDTMSGLDVPHAGCVTLNGTEALALVRSRFFSYYEDGYWHYDPTSAFGRIKRQQAFLQAVMDKVIHSLLGSPLRLNSFITAAVQHLTVNRGLKVGTLVALAKAFRHVGTSHLTGFTLPTQIVNNDGQYGDVLYPVPNLDRQTIARWEGAQPAASSSSAGAPSTTAPPAGQTGSTPSPHIATPPPPQAQPGSIVTNKGSMSYDPVAC